MPYKNKEDEKLYNKIYYRKNKERIKEKTKRYYYDNKEKCIKDNKKWQQKNKKFLKVYWREYAKKWRKDNHGRAKEAYIKWRKKNLKKAKKATAKWREKKRATVEGRLNHRMSCSIWESLRGKKAGRKWQVLVGYTLQDLIKHLESQFDDKKSWQNYGSYWHIDHIKPQSLFNYKDAKDKEFQKCWGLNNLRPLERIANIKKYNHYLPDNSTF